MKLFKRASRTSRDSSPRRTRSSSGSASPQARCSPGQLAFEIQLDSATQVWTRLTDANALEQLTAVYGGEAALATYRGGPGNSQSYQTALDPLGAYLVQTNIASHTQRVIRPSVHSSRLEPGFEYEENGRWCALTDPQACGALSAVYAGLGQRSYVAGLGSRVQRYEAALAEGADSVPGLIVQRNVLTQTKRHVRRTPLAPAFQRTASDGSFEACPLEEAVAFAAVYNTGVAQPFTRCGEAYVASLPTDGSPGFVLIKASTNETVRVRLAPQPLLPGFEYEEAPGKWIGVSDPKTNEAIAQVYAGGGPRTYKGGPYCSQTYQAVLRKGLVVQINVNSKRERSVRPVAWTVPQAVHATQPDTQQGAAGDTGCASDRSASSAAATGYHPADSHAGTSACEPSAGASDAQLSFDLPGLYPAPAPVPTAASAAVPPGASVISLGSIPMGIPLATRPAGSS